MVHFDFVSGCVLKNKIVINQFAQYPRWWEPFATIEDFNNLQSVKWITLGGVGALAVVAWLLLLARVVDGVFLAGRDLGAEAPALLAMGLLLIVRAGAVHAAEVTAQRASGCLCREVRHGATAHLAAVGPVGLDEERVADLGVTVGHGIDSLDAYTTAFLPAAALAGVVPVVVLVAVGVLDPLTTLVLFFAGPMLILLLAVIGGRTRALTERRLTEMGWLSSFYLDMVRGLPTLIAFRRAEDSADRPLTRWAMLPIGTSVATRPSRT